MVERHIRAILALPVTVLIVIPVVLVVLSWIPLAMIARARAVKTTKPRIHLVQDMDNQPKYKTQSTNAMFEDNQAMRPPTISAGRPCRFT